MLAGLMIVPAFTSRISSDRGVTTVRARSEHASTADERGNCSARMSPIAVNVYGHLLLIPRYGFYAAAWMTSFTEVAGCRLGVLSLRHHLDFRRLALGSRRPLLATGVTTLVALPLLSTQYLALAWAAVTFLAAAAIARAWPPELTSALSRRATAASRGVE
jgi:hypothetical protein